MSDQDETRDQPTAEKEFHGKVLEATSLGIATFTADGQCVSVNEALCSMIGAGREEVWQHNFREMDSWKRFGLLVDADEVLSTGLEKRREILVVRSFDKEVWLDCRLNRFTAGGEPRLLLIVNDTTHHKRMEEGLRKSEATLRGILSLSPVGIGLTQNRRIIWVNESWVKMFGFQSAHEFSGKSARIIYRSREEFERVGKLLYENPKGGEITETDAKFVKRDGAPFDGYVRIKILDTNDPGKDTIVVIYDITDRKLAEEALRESEERFRTVFEGANDCIFIKDLDLRFTHVNPAMKRLFRFESSEILGWRAEDLFGEEAGRLIRDGDLRVLKGESIEEEQSRLVNGVRLTFHEVRTPLKNDAGEVVGICGISREITDRKKAQLARTAPEPEHYPSVAMRATMRAARYASETDSLVLLLGESGSGKDYLAQWIHDHSRRSSGPYFSVNCAAISKELAESELFGHEAGAFTGARARKKGLLELAESGTLLLNEIGELPLSLQAKLLTFLDTREFLRVGGEKAVHVNARLIAATHRNLETDVAEGRFLAALFHRLNVFTITMPPLRERIEDIPVLLEESMSKLAKDLQLTELPAIDAAGMKTIMNYAWPGNVRELRNVLERALMLSHGYSLNIMLPSHDERSHKVSFGPGKTFQSVIDEVTQWLCEHALQRTGGSKKEAADLLDISRGALYRYMKRVGMPRDDDTSR
jgi:PAS domain S-box-containing protein